MMTDCKTADTSIQFNITYIGNDGHNEKVTLWASSYEAGIAQIRDDGGLHLPERGIGDICWVPVNGIIRVEAILPGTGSEFSCGVSSAR